MPVSSIPKGSTLIQNQGGSVLTNGNSHTSGYGRGSSPGTTLRSPTGSSSQINTGFRRGIQRNRGRSGRLRGARSGTRGIGSTASRLNNPAANAIRARTTANLQSNFAKTPTNLPKTAPVSAGSKVLAGGSVATAFGAASTSSAGALGLTGVASVPLTTTIALGSATLGLGLILGNTIYENIGRPFGPSLGDHIRSITSGNIDPNIIKGDSTPTNEFYEIPIANGGQDPNRFYNVTYRERLNGGAWTSTTLNNIQGDIGLEYRITVQEETGVQGENYRITSQGQPLPFFQGTAGSSDITVFDLEFEITNIVPVDGNPDTGGNRDVQTSSPAEPVTRSSPISLPRSSPTSIPTSPQQQQTPFQPFQPETPPLPIGVPAKEDGTVDIALNPVLPEQSISNTPVSSTTPTVTTTTTTTTSTGTQPTLENTVTARTPSGNPLLPGNLPAISPTITDPVVPTPSTQPETTPELEETTEEGLGFFDRLEQRFEQFNDPTRGLAPALLLAPGQLDLLQTEKPPSNPNTPTTGTSSSCGCNAGINNHTDQAIQGLSDKIDGINPLDAAAAANLGLIATVLEVVNSISSVVGVNLFPFNTISSLNGKNAAQKTINNLPELVEQNATHLDSVMGKWPNTFQVDGQAQEVEDDTLSDSISEIKGMLMALALGQGLNQQGIVKGLTEMQGIKATTLLGKEMTQGVVEYLGFRGNRVTRQVPTTITPNQLDITQLFNPSTQPMQGFANTDNTDLQTCLRELCQAAAIIRAVHYRDLDPNDIEGGIRERIKSAQDLRDAKGTYSNLGIKDDLDQFISDVEQGFGNPNIYGRPDDQRPDIRRQNTDGTTNP